MNIDQIRTIREQVEQFDDKGVCDIRLCFRCEVYFTHFHQEAQGLLHFYETILPLIRDSVRFFDVDGKNRPKKIKEDVFTMLPHWARLEDQERSVRGLSLESGTTKDDKSDRALRFFSMYLGSGAIAFFLPIEMALSDGFDVMELITAATGKLRFLHGTAGFGLNIAPGYPSQYEDFAIYGLSRRYRGIEMGKWGWFSLHAQDGIPCVNWLTLIGSDFLKRLGGATALEPLEAEDVRIRSLDHGILVQAGAEPSFGDVNRGETLRAYHAVGRVLRPLRVRTGRIERWDGIGGQDNTQEWLSRFDD